MSTDFYPQSMDARAAWHLNFANNLPTFTTKYALAVGPVASANSDSDWMQAWVANRHAFDAAGQQLTSYFNTITGKDASAPAPVPFLYSLTGTVAEVPPGIEKRARDLARQIKGHAHYSEADGELLGIATPGGGGPNIPIGNAKPAIELTTRVAFEVGVKFRKFGMTGIRIEYRHQGGDWLSAGSLFTSPGIFQVAPNAPNTPEQIEVRAVYLQGNTPTGDYSDRGSVFVGP